MNSKGNTKCGLTSVCTGMELSNLYGFTNCWEKSQGIELMRFETKCNLRALSQSEMVEMRNMRSYCFLLFIILIQVSPLVKSHKMNIDMLWVENLKETNNNTYKIWFIRHLFKLILKNYVTYFIYFHSDKIREWFGPLFNFLPPF